MGHKVMTDKQIRRAILRVNTGISEQILQLSGSKFRLMRTEAGWHVTNLKDFMWKREYVANFSQVPTVEDVRQAVNVLLSEDVVDS